MNAVVPGTLWNLVARWSKRRSAQIALVAALVVAVVAGTALLSGGRGDDGRHLVAEDVTVSSPPPSAEQTVASPTPAAAPSPTANVTVNQIEPKRVRVKDGTSVWYLDYIDIKSAESAEQYTETDVVTVVAVARNSTYPTARYYVTDDQDDSDGRPRGINVVDCVDLPTSTTTDSSDESDGSNGSDSTGGGEAGRGEAGRGDGGQGDGGQGDGDAAAEIQRRHQCTNARSELDSAQRAYKRTQESLAWTQKQIDYNIAHGLGYASLLMALENLQRALAANERRLAQAQAQVATYCD